MRRTLTLFGTGLLLWAMVTELNHAIAAWHIYVFAGALYIVFGALTQPPRSGLAITLLAGLVSDANSPVYFGTHLLLFAAAHLTLFQMRDRVPREDSLSIIFVTLITNLALFLVLSFSQIHDSPAPTAAWSRLVVDLLCSQVLVAIATPWFFALQTQTLVLTRVSRLKGA
jgi:hypothetical protein